MGVIYRVYRIHTDGKAKYVTGGRDRNKEVAMAMWCVMMAHTKPEDFKDVSGMPEGAHPPKAKAIELRYPDGRVFRVDLPTKLTVREKMVAALLKAGKIKEGDPLHREAMRAYRQRLAEMFGGFEEEEGK